MPGNNPNETQAPPPHVQLAQMATAYWGSDIVHVAAKLGLAGLAQVSGYRAEAKNDQDVIESTKLDIKYIEDWSLPLDFWIILKTMRQVVSPPKTAY